MASEAPGAPGPPIVQQEKPKYVREEKPKKEEVEEKEPVDVRFDVYLHRQVDPSIINFRLMTSSVGDKKRLGRTVVAFDLDRTLKYASLLEKGPLKDGQTNALPLIKVRGGSELIKLLEHLKAHRAIMMVFTARRPSIVKHQTVEHELERLGLMKYFASDLKPDWQNVGDENSPSRVFGGNGIWVCEYYKPHGFLRALKLRHLTPQRILFIDDFVVNVASFADHLKINADHDNLKALKSFEGVWFDPQKIIDAGDMGASNSENSYSLEYTAYRKMFKGVKQDEVDPKQIKLNSFHHKVRYGSSVEEITEIVKDPDFDLEGTDKYGRTGLSVVCKRGFKELTKLLIESKSNLDSVCDRNNTAIMYAAMGGHEEICDLLINAKADLTKENKFYRRCDVIAAKQGHSELSDKLIAAGVYADCN